MWCKLLEIQWLQCLKRSEVVELEISQVTISESPKVVLVNQKLDGGTSFSTLKKHVLRKAYGCFPKIGVPQNGWFIMENPIELDDLEIPLFLETSVCLFCLGFFCSSSTEVLHVQLLEHANSQNCFSDLLHGDADACKEFTKSLLRC